MPLCCLTRECLGMSCFGMLKTTSLVGLGAALPPPGNPASASVVSPPSGGAAAATR